MELVLIFLLCGLGSSPSCDVHVSPPLTLMYYNVSVLPQPPICSLPNHH